MRSPRDLPLPPRRGTGKLAAMTDPVDESSMRPGLDKSALEERGDDRIDAILRLVDEASRPRPLAEVLHALCSECAEILHADVASLYLRHKARDDRERGDELRIVANVGFPAGAASRVRLRVGEGVVGHVAESHRPVSLVLATEHGAFKPFPELGEERFPIFLAVPLMAGRRAEGVLVLQREHDAWSQHDVALAAALAPAFALALERAEQSRLGGERGEEPRSARLEGQPLSPGAELGRIETLPTFEGMAALERARLGDRADSVAAAEVAERRSRVGAALAEVVRDLSRMRKRLGPALAPAELGQLESLALLEDDGRLVESMEAECGRGNVALAMRKVAREYAQAAVRAARGAPANATLLARSEEVEDLCLLVAARAVGERAPTADAVLVVPERLTAVVALLCAAYRTAAVAICSPVDGSTLGTALVRAAAIPAVGDVGGLYAWARAGDVALVDGDEGTVRVSPSAAQIARFRQRERNDRR